MRFNLLALPAAALILLAGASPSLQAQDVKFGMELGLAAPRSDLKTFVDSNTGFGLGFHMLLDLGGGHTLRPRLEGWAYKSDKASMDLSSGGTIATLSGSLKVSQGSLALDYLYFTEGSPKRGPYVLAGLGVASNKFELNLTASAVGPYTYTSATGTGSDSYTNATFSVGGGYQFNARWGLEARYDLTRTTDPFNTDESVTLGAISVLGTFRF